MKLPKCKICKNEFIKTRPLQPTCTRYECMVEYASQHLSKSVKEKKKQDTKAKKEFNQNDKVYLKELAQKVFNTYIRMRDKGNVCISCQKPYDGKFDCGHFKPRGGNSCLAFSEENCNGQCQKCNRFLGANLIGYRKGLIEKIGLERVEYLDTCTSVKKWTVDEYKDIIKKYRLKTKELRL